jgi:hypothetical protein
VHCEPLLVARIFAACGSGRFPLVLLALQLVPPVTASVQTWRYHLNVSERGGSKQSMEFCTHDEELKDSGLWPEVLVFSHSVQQFTTLWVKSWGNYMVHRTCAQSSQYGLNQALTVGLQLLEAILRNFIPYPAFSTIWDRKS